MNHFQYHQILKVQEPLHENSSNISYVSLETNNILLLKLKAIKVEVLKNYSRVT